MADIPNIGSVMTASPKCVAHDCSLLEAEQLMEQLGVRHLPVTLGPRFVGLISDRQLKLARELQRESAAESSVGEICEKDVYAVAPSARLDEVVLHLAKTGIGSAVVLDHGVVAGIFTTVDACRELGDLLRRSSLCD